MRRKINFLLLMFIMTMSISLNSLAATTSLEDTEENQDLFEPTKLFVEQCDNFFNNPDKYQAIDNNGDNVTNAYYQRHIQQYKDNNYIALWETFTDELAGFSWEENETDMFQPFATSATISKTASKSFYGLKKTKKHQKGKAVEFSYKIKGKYKVNKSTKKITSASAPTITIDYSSPGALFSARAVNISTSKSINSSKTSVTFKGSFSTELSFQEKYTGITLWTENVGKSSGSVVGKAN